MIATQVDPEEIQTTRGEKLLTFVLAAFLLVGGLWIYFQPLDQDHEDPYSYVAPRTTLSSADQAALNRSRSARSELRSAQREKRAALGELEVAREGYRTALDAGQPAASLAQAYQQADARYTDAGQRISTAQSKVRAAAPAAAKANRKIHAAEDKLQAERRAEKRKTFVLRLIYVLLTLGAAYWLLGALRAGRSRYAGIGLAAVGFAALQALVMATDYTTDYLDFTDVGPLVLSLVGTTFTLLAFVALQRYVARQTPRRRVRRHECPFCGFPARDNEHCEGCGREVVGRCTSCSGNRRVGTAHCAHCGVA
jgi:hypothetical protein